MLPSLDRIRIVLCATSHPGNIGGSARAMQTMGLPQLVLINPLRFPDPDAVAMAAGAGLLLNSARLGRPLDAALAVARAQVDASAAAAER